MGNTRPDTFLGFLFFLNGRPGPRKRGANDYRETDDYRLRVYIDNASTSRRRCLIRGRKIKFHHGDVICAVYVVLPATSAAAPRNVVSLVSLAPPRYCSTRYYVPPGPCFELVRRHKSSKTRPLRKKYFISIRVYQPL